MTLFHGQIQLDRMFSRWLLAVTNWTCYVETREKSISGFH